jgi:hypothetical protein
MGGYSVCVPGILDVNPIDEPSLAIALGAFDALIWLVRRLTLEL